MTEDRTTGDRAAGGPSAGRPRPAPAPRSARAHHGPPQGPAHTRPPLTTEDLRRLTLYKWRYSLESVGFTGEQVSHLLFLKWLYATNAIRG